MKIGSALAADLAMLTVALDEPGAEVLHSLTSWASTPERRFPPTSG